MVSFEAAVCQELFLYIYQIILFLCIYQIIFPLPLAFCIERILQFTGKNGSR